MVDPTAPQFRQRGNHADIEGGLTFQPKFDDNGLIPAIVTSNGDVVMFAWMNRQALWQTIASREAHFWSRSRKTLWRKGEDSGNVLTVRDIRVDCDQDVVLLDCTIAGAGKACHTGARSCFYRALEAGAAAPSEVSLKLKDP